MAPRTNHHNNAHLPPRLREICDLLTRGLLRLRSRTAERLEQACADRGEFRLHLTATQRRHANRTNRRDA